MPLTDVRISLMANRAANEITQDALIVFPLSAFARPRRGKRISWSSEEESLLGKITDEKFAKRFSRPIHLVKNIAATSAYRTTLLIGTCFLA